MLSLINLCCWRAFSLKHLGGGGSYTKDDQVNESSFPTYQTMSAQLLRQGTSQSILMTEWLIESCLNDHFFHVRKHLHCDAIWSGFVVCLSVQGSWAGLVSQAAGCCGSQANMPAAALWAAPKAWLWSLPCQAPTAMQTWSEAANIVKYISYLPWALNVKMRDTVNGGCHSAWAIK